MAQINCPVSFWNSCTLQTDGLSSRWIKSLIGCPLFMTSYWSKNLKNCLKHSYRMTDNVEKRIRSILKRAAVRFQSESTRNCIVYKLCPHHCPYWSESMLRRTSRLWLWDTCSGLALESASWICALRLEGRPATLLRSWEIRFLCPDAIIINIQSIFVFFNAVIWLVHVDGMLPMN